MPDGDACDGCERTDWTVRVENQGRHYCGPCYVDRLARGEPTPSPARKPVARPRR